MQLKKPTPHYQLLATFALIIGAFLPSLAQALAPPCNPGLICSTVYAPVCGVDGQTYPNSCEAARYCVAVAYSGVCAPPPPICRDTDLDGYSPVGGACGPVDCNDVNPNINPGVICRYVTYAPVCGVNGITYNGLCDADKVCVAVAYNGVCGQPPACADLDQDGYSPAGGNCGPVDCNDSDPAINPGMICATVYAPVCGVNGTTYSNACGARQACMAIAHDGECYQQPTCTDVDADGYAIEGDLCGEIDCNDLDPTINPDATEIIDNTLDENCNGMTDDLFLLGTKNDPASEGSCLGHSSYVTSGLCTPQIMGQEFIASHNNLAAVELLLNNLKGVPANIAINIRENSMAGQIIGSATYTSDPISNTKNWLGWALFEFAEPISLIPGNAYVIELIHATTISTAWYSQTNARCNPPVSGAIICDTLRPTESFYFRTFAEELIDSDQDGFSPPVDCNDSDAAINPDAFEIPYSSMDENCNGMSDDLDFDQDGYPITEDCDDSNPAINPDVLCSTIYAPVCGSDGYNYGNSCQATQACVAIANTGLCPPICTDRDRDGFALEGKECGPVDCNDNNGAINPGATEVKNNHTDENCTGMGDDLEVLPIITKAEYSKKDRVLTVIATSQLGRNDSLAVEGFGTMTWNNRKGNWSLVINKLAASQALTTITVSGLYGKTTANVTWKR